jgi:hypothetical protein
MDFVMNLPADPVYGFDAILFVIDRFSKHVTLIPTFTSVTGQGSCDLLFKHIFSRFGYPISIISDRDPKFTGQFCTQYLLHCGITANMSSGGHAETDGASERVIRVWEEMIRCHIDFDRHNLFTLLPVMEFAMNDSPRPDTKLSPFQMFLGFTPLRPADIATSGYKLSKVQSIQSHFDSLIAQQTHVIDAMREAQSKYIFQANKHRRAVPLATYHVDDLVYVKRTNFVPPAVRDCPLSSSNHVISDHTQS